MWDLSKGTGEETPDTKNKGALSVTFKKEKKNKRPAHIKVHQRDRETKGHGANIRGRVKLKCLHLSVSCSISHFVPPMIILISWFWYFKSDFDVIFLKFVDIQHASYPKQDSTQTCLHTDLRLHKHAPCLFFFFFYMQAKTMHSAFNH